MMSTQSQWIASSSPADLPLKRKRGRPRKDESLVQGENIVAMPGSDSVKKSQQSVGAASAIGNNMVGQVVSGVIEGSFDAGYLLKVKVGDTDTHLRGVVFLPGRFIPITAANDVAPEAKMHKRIEMPIPVSNMPIQLPHSVPVSEQGDKQLVKLKNPAPMVRDQGQPSQIQSSVPTAHETMPLLTNYLPTSTPGPSLEGKVKTQQILVSVIESQPTSIVAHMGHDRAVKQDEVLQDMEVSGERNTDVAAAEQSKSAPQSTPAVDICSGTETVGLELQFQHQAANNDLKPNQLVPDAVKSLNIEHNTTPVNTEPGIISSEPSGINMWMEKQASPKEAAPSEIAANNSTGSDTSHLTGSPVSHAANIASTGLSFTPVASLPANVFERDTVHSSPKAAADGHSLQSMIGPESFSSGATNLFNASSGSAPMTSLPVTLFERDAIPSESMIAIDGPDLPRRIEPQLCSSSGAANNIGCSITDAIPPTES